MTYLREFATQADYEAAVAAGLAKPNVSLVNEPFGVQYKQYVPLGVFIQHVDGTLYTTDEWTAKGFVNDHANGVAVVDTVSFVVASYRPNKFWSTSSKLVENVVTSTSEEGAILDLNGKNNTAVISSNYADGAASLCSAHIFKNGKKGYLGAAGELAILSKHAEEIKEAGSLIGQRADLGYGELVWTSTQCSSSEAWLFDLGQGLLTKGVKSRNYRAFTFCEL